MGLTDSTIISRGVIVALTSALSTGNTGTTRSQYFCIAANPASLGSVKLQVRPNDPADDPVTITALDIDLECSVDGGETWATEQTGLDFAAAATVTLGLTQGPIYRLNITSITVDNPVEIIGVLG